MPTPKSPPPIADFARFIAPWTAASSNGWTVRTVVPRDSGDPPFTRGQEPFQVALPDDVRIHPGSGFLREPIRREADDDGLRPAVEGGTEQGLMPRVQEVERPAEDDAHLADHPVDTI